jgi:hypothetical protein
MMGENENVCPVYGVQSRLSELKIERHEKAQTLIDALYNRQVPYVTIHRPGSIDPDDPTKTLTQEKITVSTDTVQTYWNLHCPDLPNIPEQSFWFFEAVAQHRLSYTIDADNKAMVNPTKPYIPSFGKEASLLIMEFPEFEFNDTLQKQAALTPQTKKILHKPFGTDDPTNISRATINQVLWSDHDARIPSSEVRGVIAELLGPGQNPDLFELRLMCYDEYARASSSLGFGQKYLRTHFEGYSRHADGSRRGLGGGNRDLGGAADVGLVSRGDRIDTLAVRLVLSRK